MEERSSIQSKVYYDLELHKEFTRLSAQVYTVNIILWSITALSILYLFTNFDRPFTVKMFLGLSLYFLIIRLVTYFRNRDGGTAYKRILYQNNGNIPLQTVILEESTIRTHNEVTSNELLTPYDNIRFLAESRNLLLIVTDLKMVQILNKNTLSVGSREDVIAFLRHKCPKLKKRIRHGLPGRIVNIVLCILVVIGVIWSSAILLRLPEKLSGQLHNDMSYREMAEELSALDITISDQTIQELEEYDREYAQEYGDYYEINYDASKISDLLYWEGCGVYDENTGYWTPSSSGIYWFDMEFFNADTMYTDFLMGVCAMNDSLTFSAITEDHSNVDFENSTGTVNFSFIYEGQTHHFIASFQSDWFDMNMLYEVGAVLAADQDYKDLWHAFDGGQGIILYYGTKEQADELSDLVGLDFYNCVKSSIAK